MWIIHCVCSAFRKLLWFNSENGDGRRGRRMGGTQGVFVWGRNSVMTNLWTKDAWGKRRTILVEISHFTDEKFRAGIVKALQGENLKDYIRDSLCHLVFFPIFTPDRRFSFKQCANVMLWEHSLLWITRERYLADHKLVVKNKKIQDRIGFGICPSCRRQQNGTKWHVPKFSYCGQWPCDLGEGLGMPWKRRPEKEGFQLPMHVKPDLKKPSTS